MMTLFCDGDVCVSVCVMMMMMMMVVVVPRVVVVVSESMLWAERWRSNLIPKLSFIKRV